MWWICKVFLLRLVEFFLRWPYRLYRLVRWMIWIDRPRGLHVVLRWISGYILMLIDLTPTGVVLEFLLDLIKWKNRPMSEAEIAIARSIFGKALHFSLIGIDAHSTFAKKNKTTAFVSLHTLHFDKEISNAILIHELVHVWQYKTYGSLYISESIWAQRWGEGYNYGGIDALQKHITGAGLAAFNFEQQADIVEEYYRWKNGLSLQWAQNSPEIGNLLQKYCETVRR